MAVDAAVHHAMAAGNSDHAAALVQASWLRYFDAGLGSFCTLLAPDFGVFTRRAQYDNRCDVSLDGGSLGQREEMGRRLVQLNDVADDAVLPDGTKSRGADSRTVRLRRPCRHAGLRPPCDSSRRMATRRGTPSPTRHLVTPATWLAT